MIDEIADILQHLMDRFPATGFSEQHTCDGIVTVWVSVDTVHPVLRFLKEELPQPFRVLYDLSAIDERVRTHREGQPKADFSVFYHLYSYERKSGIRIKVPLLGDFPTIDTVTALWPNANWYERELWDMFGIGVAGHPDLKRILMPPWWDGHPLRKEHPSRATEMGVFHMPEERQAQLMESMRFAPESWGMTCDLDGFDCLFLNIGPQHPGTHGVFRIITQLDGQEIVGIVCDIGYHHRAAEKMGERQTWHTYIPYTDRVDYLSGVMNNFPYVMAVEQLAGIVVPDRAKVIRVMLAELFRVINHLVFLGTFSQDLGMMSPVFYMFTDRERAFGIVEAVTGARMHPGWFRIGGVAQDLPEGWDALVRDFLGYMRRRLKEYEGAVLRNRIFQARTRGIGAFTTDEAIAWGATGPMLRSTGMAWDLRKAIPYSGYDQFEFEVPVGVQGDCYDRATVHLEEMWQSLGIIEQCLNLMPGGLYKAKHPLTTPPLKEYTLRDIETLISHFENVTWGPVIPAGEAHVTVESTKGSYGYYLVSDGSTSAYRTRIRAASFPHLQMLPAISRGVMVPDLIAILGSIDFVMSDVDR